MTEIFHQAALGPIVLCAVLHLLGLKIRREFWFVAAAFGVSWFGDALGYWIPGAWTWLPRLWLPVQFGLILWAYIPNPLHRVMALWSLAMLAAVPSVGPDRLVTVGGSVMVLWAALHGSLLPCVYLYWGVGSVAYLIMAGQIGEPTFLMTWYVYQAIRMASFVLFAGAVIHAGNHVGVSAGRRAHREPTAVG